ncbi:MAG: hypothetical protein IKH87_04475, partial [Firmicutes bacterium]|nr:hypothetical protein [Bacillota bacterium]
LSKSQRRSLTVINALFGSLLLTSDDIGSYDKEKKAILEEALQLFREGNVLDCRRKDRSIQITYELQGKQRRLHYEFNRGILREE